jgi:hypothetical protein
MCFFLFYYKSEDHEDKRKAFKKITEKYQNYIGEEFENELIHFHEHVVSQVRELQEDENSSKVIDIMKQILLEKCFPNVAVAFRIYLTMPSLVHKDKKSFSKLSFARNKKRQCARIV